MAKTKEATTEPTKTEPVPQRVRKPVIKAGPCPKNPDHKATKVYKTDGRTRRCKCNDCGHTWKLSADYADDLYQYVYELVNDLESAGTIDTEEGPVVVLSDSFRNDLVKDLRELLESK